MSEENQHSTAGINSTAPDPPAISDGTAPNEAGAVSEAPVIHDTESAPKQTQSTTVESMEVDDVEIKKEVLEVSVEDPSVKPDIAGGPAVQNSSSTTEVLDVKVEVGAPSTVDVKVEIGAPTTAPGADTTESDSQTDTKEATADISGNKVLDTSSEVIAENTSSVVDRSKTKENGSQKAMEPPTESSTESTDGATSSKMADEISPAQETLKRGDEGFTSEIYRIKVDSLPKYTNVAALKKKLVQLGIKPIKCNILGTKQYPYAFVTFENEDIKQKALKVLNDTTWKNMNLSAIHTAPKKGTQLVGEKRSADGSANNDQRAKKPKSDLPPHEQINDKVASYWRLPYEQQLTRKNGIVDSVMQTWKKELRKAGVKWVNASPLCPVEPIIPSEVTTGYRNKCEFSLGHSPEGEVHAGFLLGGSADGTNVVRPTACPIVSKNMKAVALHFEKFITDISKLPIFTSRERTGYWRLLLVRETHAGEIMIVAQLHPQQLTATEIADQGKLLGSYFSEDFLEGKVKSISLQKYEGMSHGFGEDIQLVHGPPVLEETLMGLKFDISPKSFFQVNHGGAEKLYSLIRQWAGEPKLLGRKTEGTKEAEPQSVCEEGDGAEKTGSQTEADDQEGAQRGATLSGSNVLDVCCGTGTIGMLMAPVSNKVFGVDIVESAIEDARKNAIKNGVTNIEFVCGKAEAVLGKLVDTALLDNKGLMGILDPPRAGLHKDVVKVIRATPKLERLIYVACDARQSLSTLTSLCRPTSNNYVGVPFRPMKVTAADLFPHTHNFEFVVLLEREKAQ